MSNPTNPTNAYTVPSASITTASTGASGKANGLGSGLGRDSEIATRGERQSGNLKNKHRLGYPQL